MRRDTQWRGHVRLVGYVQYTTSRRLRPRSNTFEMGWSGMSWDSLEVESSVNECVDFLEKQAWLGMSGRGAELKGSLGTDSAYRATSVIGTL